MCGGYSCCLLANQLCYACVYKRNEVQYRAKWITTLANARHSAAITCSPRTMRAVLLSNKTAVDIMPSLNYNFKLNIALMNWGYFCTSPSKYLMINARSDNLFKVKKCEEAMMMNRRCVILADGYYETCQKTNKKHFIFLPASPEYRLKVLGEDERYNRKLMHMAGIFIENNEKDDKEGFSFVIITVDASESVSKIHSRMPAILETDEDVLKWLNPDEYPSAAAARLLKPVECTVMETNVKTHCQVPDKDGSIQMRITDFMKPPSPKKQKR
ncbi:Abasic site processing protein HMCES [Trichinella pseudospiralis]